MKVKDVMHKGVDWVSPETPISELAKLMQVSVEYWAGIESLAARCRSQTLANLIGAQDFDSGITGENAVQLGLGTVVVVGVSDHDGIHIGNIFHGFGVDARVHNQAVVIDNNFEAGVAMFNDAHGPNLVLFPWSST